MDKIDELIDNIEASLMGCGDEDVEYANRCAKELSVSRATLRAEFDAQALRIAELEKEVHDVSVYLNKNHAPVVDWNLKPGYAAVELLKKFYSEKVELKSELAALKEALDISHKNHDRCNRDYVLLKKHLDGINRAVDVLCPKVARAITKLTPPSIADAYRADHQFARELRAALNDVTDAQNTVYKPEAE